ncbi:hypothetical protein B0H13DRAFT_1936652 [Mycena leptocephala]|nr:hypothetical protein B0H13DRAFT_1936652 [Mycena leptocephala]
MDNAPAPGTKLNPILLPESPPLAKRIKKIIGGPPSSIEAPSPHTREAVLRRIRELEDTSRILTPAATNHTPLAGPSNTRDEPIRRPRTILALEASLLESRTAVRSAQAARIARMAASISGPAQYPGPRGGGGDQNIGTNRGSRCILLLGRTAEARGIAQCPTQEKTAWTIGLKDVWAEWVPMPDGDFGEDAPETVVNPSTVLGKRKEYASTVDPMSLFRPMKAFFVDELLRHEGLGDDQHLPHCALCEAAFEPGIPDSPRLFKCSDCGQFLQCESCCLETTHGLLFTLYGFWVDTTLANLGLVYQLGHGGFPCPFPDDAVHNMTVIEAPIIHQIRFRYCKCNKSDDADNLEQLMRNAWYPATVTDPGTCATFQSLELIEWMTWLPERYKQFQRMARQWSFLKRLRRAGRGHDPEAYREDQAGQCASTAGLVHMMGAICLKLARVDPKYQFLYMLIIAVDANFRLKNRMRANEIDDPSLGPVGDTGWTQRMNEKDVSTCIAFAALLSKGHAKTTGLRVSGVGGCVCARHECMRPNGLGNLQKGER